MHKGMWRVLGMVICALLCAGSLFAIADACYGAKPAKESPADKSGGPRAHDSKLGPSPDGCVYRADLSVTIKNGKVVKHRKRAVTKVEPGLMLKGIGDGLCHSIGSPKICALCVDFNGAAGTKSMAQYQAMLFGSAPSVRDFYLETSQNQLSLQGQALGWYRIAGTPPTGWDNLSGLLVSAVAAADANGVDFSTFDANQDGNVDAVYVIPARASFRACAMVGCDIEVDGVHIKNASFEGENAGWQTFSHELGHQMGLPDLYYEWADGTFAWLGLWSHMANGSFWGAHMDAWSKIELGWVTPVTLSQNQTGVVIPPVETSGVVYKLTSNGSSSGEYFLVENRQPIGYEANMPINMYGLAIYHITDSQSASVFIHLEEADAGFDLLEGGNIGQTSDPWPGSLGKTNFNVTTSPSSRTYTNHPTLVGVNSITPSGQNIVCDLQVTLPDDTVRPGGTDVRTDTNVLPGASIPVERICLNTNGDPVTITGLRVDLTGLGSDSYVPTVRLYDDQDGDGAVDTGEPLLATAQVSGLTALFSGLSYVASGAEQNHLLLVCDVSSSAALGSSFILSIPASGGITVAAGQTVDTLTMPIESGTVTISSFTSQTSWSYTAPSTATPLLADLDCDGDQDIVYVDQSGFSGWRICAADSQGTNLPTWSTPMSPISGCTCKQLAVSDITGDAIPEVVIADSSGQLRAYTNHGLEIAGWPQKLDNNAVCEHMTLADIDGDGDSEVVVSTDQNAVCVYDGNGRLMWQTSLDGTNTTIPVVGDVDGDGSAEVVAACYSKVYVWNHDGTILDPAIWPVQPVSHNPGDPVLVNLDSDPALEILVPGWGGILAYKANGQPPAGSSWPYTSLAAEYLAIGNICGDSSPEIVFMDLHGPARALNLDGTVALSGSTSGLPEFRTPAACVDVNQDGYVEVLATGQDNKLYAFTNTGSQVPGWPVPLSGAPSPHGPSVGNMDADGYLEVVTGDSERISIFEVHQPYAYDALQWPMYQQDVARSGRGPEKTRPTVMNTYNTDSTHVTVWFSEHVNPVAAANAANYSIDNGISVLSASVTEEASRTTVSLTTSALSAGTTYTVTATGISDLAGNVVGTPNSGQFNTSALSILGVVQNQSYDYFGVLQLDCADVLFSGPVVGSSGTYTTGTGLLTPVVTANLGSTTQVCVGACNVPITVQNVTGISGGTLTPNPTQVTPTLRPVIAQILWVDDTHVDVVFGGNVDQTSALNAANYYINPGLAVQSAALYSGNPLTVRLTTATQTSGAQYTLAAPGVVNSLGCPGNGKMVVAGFMASPRPAVSLDFEQTEIRLHADGTESVVLKVWLKDDVGRVASMATNPVQLSFVRGQDSAILQGTNPAVPVNGCAQITLKSTFLPGEMEVRAESGSLTADTVSGYVTPSVQDGWPNELSDQPIYSSPAIADIDGDGATETVIGTQDGTVVKLEADGTASTIATLGHPIKLAPAVGDIDLDGQPEIVVVADGSVYGLELDGTVIFDTGTTVTSASSSPALGDIDDDGYLEIVVGSDYMHVCAFNHDGTVATGWPRGANDPVHGTPALGDIDGDGSLEIVAGDSTGCLFAWNGDGTTVSSWMSSTDWEDARMSLGLTNIVCSPALADLDNDRKLEIIVGTSVSVSTGGYICALNEDGSFVTGWPVNLGYSIWAAPAVGDLNCDGTLDVVVACRNGKVYARTATGTATPGWVAPTMGGTVSNDYTYRQSSPILANIDGDDALEVIIGCSDGKVYAYEPNGSLVSEWPKATGGDVRSTVAVGNLDGDQQWDVIVGSNDGGVYRWEIGSLASGVPVPWTTFHGDNQRTGRYVLNVTLDDTSITTPYVAVKANQTASLRATLFRTTGNVPIAGKPVIFRIGSAIVGIAQTDASGIATVSYTATATPGQYTLSAEFAGDALHEPCSGTNTLAVLSSDALAAISSHGTSIAMADLNGDGLDETILGSADGKVHVLDANGAELTGWPQTLSSPVVNPAAVGDIDNDGVPEIVVAGGGGQYGGDLYAFELNGTLVSGSWPQETASPTTFEASSGPALGDIDGDGYLEIVVGSSTMSVSAYNHDGSVCSGWPQSAMDPVYGTPALGDIDGDGALEIVAGDTTGFLWAWNGDGTVVSTWPTQYQLNRGAITSSPALADLDDDGKQEIIVCTFNWGTPSGYIVALNEDGSVLTNWDKYNSFTGFWASPAVGDVDGDGSLDVVVAGRNARVYSFTKTGAVTPGWTSQAAGTGPAMDYTYIQSSPVLSDIDGDGAMEIIIGSCNGMVYAFNNDASSVTGWPKSTGGEIRATCAVGNADGDSSWDVVTASSDGGVYLWETGGDTARKPADKFPWPTFHGDNLRSGNFRIMGQDSFTRTGGTGWGTAEIGGPWTDLDVVTGASFTSIGAVVGLQNYEGWTEPYTGWSTGLFTLSPFAGDADVTAKMSIGDVSGKPGVVARASSYNTFYAAIVSFYDAELQIVKYQSGTPTVLGTLTGVSVVGQGVKVRLRVEGNALKARTWLAGTAEPAAWGLQVSDANPLPAGKSGIITGDDQNMYLYDDFFAEALRR